MAEVALEQVSKTYPNGVVAVLDLNLIVSDGEIVTIVGPSSCGKTTTLRLIAGLEDPTAGTVWLNGRNANALPPSERDIAMVFQKHNLYPHLTVSRNILFGLEMRHSRGWLRRVAGSFWRSDEGRKCSDLVGERVAETAEMLDLVDVLDRLPAQLSGGQYQRAAVGRALARRPAVYLLDEPLSQLDASLRSQMRQQLHLLHRRLHATMIYVTHDQLEAMTLGQRLVVLNQGVIQQVDTPERVYRRPRNRFVAGFLGWPPMNFMDGSLGQENGQTLFESGRQRLPLPPNDWSRKAKTQKVTLGIRPEHVGVFRRSGDGLKLDAEVVLVEPLGSDWLLTVQWQDWRIVAKSAARPAAAIGEKVEVSIDMEQCQWFDAASGLALDQAGPDG
jgi:multiple sugar transport system ATP-binding protein